MASFTFGQQKIESPSYLPSGGLTNLQGFLSNFLTIFILAAMFLMVIYIVWAGIQWITSGGDKQKLATARGRLTWAIIGFIISMLAIFIVNAVGYFFRVDLLKLG